jgi:hypothetical protein
MIVLPHDTTDVLLAPVALALDQQLQQLTDLTQLEIRHLVALCTDREPSGVEGRRELLLATISRDLDTHDWTLSWDMRGLKLEHETRRLVLGLPASVRVFLGL